MKDLGVMKLNSNEQLLGLMSAISVIFNMGFIPSKDEVYELSDALYVAYGRQGGDMSKRMYTVLPKNNGFPASPNEISLMSETDVPKLMKAAEFLREYAKRGGCVSDKSEDILAFAAGRFPAHFSDGTKYAQVHTWALAMAPKFGDKPATPQTEWLSLISSVLSTDESFNVKLTVREEAAAALH